MRFPAAPLLVNMKRLMLFSVEKRDNLILKPFALVLTTGDYFRTLSTSSFAEFQANRSMSRERQEGFVNTEIR